MRRLRETGTLQRIHQTYAGSSQVCPTLEGNPLGLENCIGAFLVVGMGVAVGTLTLMAEFIMKKVVTKKATIANSPKSHNQYPTQDSPHTPSSIEVANQDQDSSAGTPTSIEVTNQDSSADTPTSIEVTNQDSSAGTPTSFEEVVYLE